MPRKAKAAIEEKDLQGFKHFKLLLPVTGKPHEVGCARDRAGNRILHHDQCAALILLHFFNPIVTGLRAIQQTSKLQKVQRMPGRSRAAPGPPSGRAGRAARPVRRCSPWASPARGRRPSEARTLGPPDRTSWDEAEAAVRKGGGASRPTDASRRWT